MLHCMHTNIQVAYNLALQWTVISINLCTAGNNINYEDPHLETWLYQQL